MVAGQSMRRFEPSCRKSQSDSLTFARACLYFVPLMKLSSRKFRRFAMRIDTRRPSKLLSSESFETMRPISELTPRAGNVPSSAKAASRLPQRPPSILGAGSLANCGQYLTISFCLIYSQVAAWHAMDRAAADLRPRRYLRQNAASPFLDSRRAHLLFPSVALKCLLHRSSKCEGAACLWELDLS